MIGPLPQNQLFKTNKNAYNKDLVKSLIGLIPLCISFKDISYQIEIEIQPGIKLACCKKYESKTIIDNVSGVFRAGEITAIMGASGAGKTSLLNILACRITPQTGKIKANGTQYDFDEFGDFGNYVMQNDVLMQTLTVREALEFAATLSAQGTQQQKQQKALQIAKDLKLQQCLDTLIGGNLIKGISGGQKKRTSIALELISDPQVLMLDEPTSGLDSLTSFVIVDYLSKMAHDKGRTIIMTIHQPNSQIFAKFDSLMLMAQGRMVYQGKASHALNYFQHNFGLKCPEYVNLADYLIQILHPENTENVQRYPTYFQTYEKQINFTLNLQIQSIPEQDYTHRQVNISYLTSLRALLYRDAINLARNPVLFRGKTIQFLFVAVFSAGLCFNVGRTSYMDIINWQSITGFLFFTAFTTMNQSINAVALTFPLQRLIFLKQQGSKLYSLSAYFLSRNIIQLPFLILFPLMYSLIVYWMIGLAQTFQQFLTFYLVTFLMGLVGNSLGMLLGSSIHDPKAVSLILPLTVMPIALLSGLFKNRDNLPRWIGWIQYISPIKYGAISLIQNQVKNRQSRVKQLNLDVDLWVSIGILFIIIFVSKILSLVFLKVRKAKLQ